MTSLPGRIVGALRAGIGTVDDRGVIAPSNDAMRELLDGSADLRSLGVDDESEAELRAGEAVPLQRGGRQWQLRSVRDADATWLLADELGATDRVAAMTMELARLRALARTASSIVHDFNNMLNSCIGLASQVRPHLQDPVDQRVLQELVVGTQQGAQLARAVARLLAPRAVERVSTPLVKVFDEAMAITAKAAMQRSVKFVVDRGTETTVVRTVVAEALQSLWHGLMAIVERVPRIVNVTLDEIEDEPVGQRRRRFGRVQLVAIGLERGAMEQMVRIVAGDGGMLAALGSSPLASGLATAAFVQRRAGGDLTAAVVGDNLCVEYRWPAVK